jgi:putative nucleotidyltransferase with HDIG domain
MEKEYDASVDMLLSVIDEIAHGNYSNDIMQLTTREQSRAIRRIAEAVGLMMVKVEAREYQLEMLVEELRQLHQQVRENSIKVVSALANALSARDEYTMGHTERVSRIACEIAQYLGLEEGEVEYVRLGGILHDIGKIGFSDTLFNNHEPQTTPELMKEIVRHPHTGWKILSDLDFLGPALEYIHCHHERPDGRGYPRHKQDEEIPLGAKIIAAADAYDAMTTDRPYQKGMTKQVALGILKKHAGNKWDCRCVEALEAVLGEGEEVFPFA